MLFLCYFLALMSQTELSFLLNIIYYLLYCIGIIYQCRTEPTDLNQDLCETEARHTKPECIPESRKHKVWIVNTIHISTNHLLCWDILSMFVVCGVGQSCTWQVNDIGETTSYSIDLCRGFIESHLDSNFGILDQSLQNIPLSNCAHLVW